VAIIGIKIPEDRRDRFNYRTQKPFIKNK